MRKAIVFAAGLALIATSAWSQGMSRDRDDYYRGDRRDDQRQWFSRDGDRDRDQDRGDTRSRAGGGDDEGGRGRAARFVLRSGDSRLAVRCDDRESMRSCVDSALTMFDRVRAQSQQSGTTSGTTSGSTAPSTGGGSSPPAPTPPAR